MPEFQVTKQDMAQGITFLAVRGFLDAHTFEELDRIVGACFEAGKYRLVVDLSKLDYISSAGAGVFIGAIGTAQENDGNIILVKPSPNVKEVFDLLGLSQIFQFAETADAAAKTFH